MPSCRALNTVSSKPLALIKRKNCVCRLEESSLSSRSINLSKNPVFIGKLKLQQCRFGTHYQDTLLIKQKSASPIMAPGLYRSAKEEIEPEISGASRTGITTSETTLTTRIAVRCGTPMPLKSWLHCEACQFSWRGSKCITSVNDIELVSGASRQFSDCFGGERQTTIPGTASGAVCCLLRQHPAAGAEQLLFTYVLVFPNLCALGPAGRL